MTVQELVKKVNNKTFNLEKAIELKKYIPIMEKQKFTIDVISACTDDIDNFVSVDRFKMRVYFDIKMLCLYTNLEIADYFDEMVAQYDVLCENGLLNKVIDAIGEDYNAMSNVLNDALEELLVQNSIDAQVVKISNKINFIIDTISEKMDEVDLKSILPEGTDVNQLIEMVNMLK